MIEKVLGPIPTSHVRHAITSGLDPGLFGEDERLCWPGAATTEAALQAVRKARPLAEVVHDRQLLNLMQKMLVMSAEDRITAAEALRHPFFTQGY